jgi:hypothetical protein
MDLIIKMLLMDIINMILILGSDITTKKALESFITRGQASACPFFITYGGNWLLNWLIIYGGAYCLWTTRVLRAKYSKPL